MASQFRTLWHVQQCSRTSGEPSCFKLCKTGAGRKDEWKRERLCVPEWWLWDRSTKSMSICPKQYNPPSKERIVTHMLIDVPLSRQGRIYIKIINYDPTCAYAVKYTHLPSLNRAIETLRKCSEGWKSCIWIPHMPFTSGLETQSML